MVGVRLIGVFWLSADIRGAAHGLSAHGTTAELHDRRTAFQCLGIWGDLGGNKRRLRHTPFGASEGALGGRCRDVGRSRSADYGTAAALDALEYCADGLCGQPAAD